MHRSCINHAALGNVEGIEEKFKILSEAGFECLDFNIDVFLSSEEINGGEFNELFNSDIPTILEFFKPYKDAAEKYNVEISQAHAPAQLYVDGNDEINEKCYEMLEKSIAVANYLSCKYLVVHPVNLAFAHGRDYERKVNFEYYERLIPFAKKYNVVICLENMFSTVTRHVTEAICSDFGEAANYIDVLNEKAGGEYFGFCFDLGHATLLGKHVSESLKALGHRLKLLHIHDNDGIQDHHAIPYMLARNWGRSPATDWKGFIEGLKAINYQGEFDFEVGTVARLVPVETLPALLGYLNSVGKYFAKQLEN